VQQPPELKGAPLVGCLPELRRDRLAFLLRAYRDGGDFVRVPLPGRRLYVATSPAAASDVLRAKASSFRKFFALSKLSRPMLGGGLLTAEGEPHRRQRRLIAPGLSRREVARYADTMVRHVLRLEEGWREGDTVDVLVEMSRLTVGIASETMFGTDASSHAHAVGEAVEATLDYIANGVGSLVRFPLAWPLKRHRRVRRSLAVLDRIIYDIVAERRAGGPAAGASDATRDILGMLLAARLEGDGEGEDAGLTDEQVRDEVATLLVAGYETTASALTWTLYLLARHPEVAARLRAEVDAALGGRPPTVEDLPAMPYAMQVFKETMRLYPPGYMVGREALEDVEVGGFPIAAGATVLVSIYGLHRRPDFYPDPERFDPERFSPEREAALPRGAYLPFVDGPRVCIGYHFAMMEAHLLLAHLVSRVALEPIDANDDQPVPPQPRVTLRPGRPIAMRVRRRSVPG